MKSMKKASKPKVAALLVQKPIERKAMKGEAKNPLKFALTKRPKEVSTDRGKFGMK